MSCSSSWSLKPGSASNSSSGIEGIFPISSHRSYLWRLIVSLMIEWYIEPHVRVLLQIPRIVHTLNSSSLGQIYLRNHQLPCWGTSASKNEASRIFSAPSLRSSFIKIAFGRNKASCLSISASLQTIRPRALAWCWYIVEGNKCERSLIETITKDRRHNCSFPFLIFFSSFLALSLKKPNIKRNRHSDTYPNLSLSLKISAVLRKISIQSLHP